MQILEIIREEDELIPLIITEGIMFITLSSPRILFDNQSPLDDNARRL